MFLLLYSFPCLREQPMSMVLPIVVGFKLYGTLWNGVTATDLVLTVTQMVRKHGVVGNGMFVELYGIFFSRPFTHLFILYKNVSIDYLAM